MDEKSLKLEISERGQDRFLAVASVSDVDGNPYRSESPAVLSVTNSKVRVVPHSSDSYSYDLFVPEGKGSSEGILKIEGFETKEKFSWNYHPYNIGDVAVSLTPKRIAATGYDNARIEVSIPKLSNESAKNILQSEDFEAYIIDGE